MKPLIDVFITTYPKDEKRLAIFNESLISFKRSVKDSNVRLTIVVDGGSIQLSELSKHADHVLFHKDNLGLGPSINQALTHINTLNNYHAQRGEVDQVSDFICYCQDDVSYKDGWLDSMLKYFVLFESQKKIAFASGHDAPEHSTKEIVGEFAGQKVLTKDWIRATNMFARRSYWMSMFPISGMDPETGMKRAKPNDGMGSGVDWWFIRNHPESVCKSGKTCLVLPGLISHIGYAHSTWLKRELPEHDSDEMKKLLGYVLSV